MKYQYTIFKTRWGYFGICSTEKGVFRTCLPVKSHPLCQKLLLHGLDDTVYKRSLLRPLQKAINDYYNGAYVDFKEAIDWSDFSPFARKVLRACMKITYGRTITYKELASLSGHPYSSRAVGAVLARNPIPLIIPCHRILSSDGSLRGFSAPGGLKTKKKMLILEKALYMIELLTKLCKLS